MAGPKIMKRFGALLVTMILTVGACSSDRAATDQVGSTTSQTKSIAVAGATGDSQAMGRTDVGVITNLPAIDLEWIWPDLPLSRTNSAELSVAHAGFVGDDIVIVAFEWLPPPANQTVHTWHSANGKEWDQSALDLPPGRSMHQIVATADGIIGLGQQPSGATFAPLIHRWTVEDGWSEIDLSGAGIDLDGVILAGAATTEAGIIIGAQRDDYQAGPSTVTFEASQYRFEIDELAGTYAVTEASDERLRSAGSLADIYSYEAEGQAIYDPQTRTLLTVVPWDVWETQYAAYSPLPIPISNEGSGAARLLASSTTPPARL